VQVFTLVHTFSINVLAVEDDWTSENYYARVLLFHDCHRSLVGAKNRKRKAPIIPGRALMDDVSSGFQAIK
jgi:hypothetical protein